MPQVHVEYRKLVTQANNFINKLTSRNYISTFVPTSATGARPNLLQRCPPQQSQHPQGVQFFIFMLLCSAHPAPLVHTTFVYISFAKLRIPSGNSRQAFLSVLKPKSLKFNMTVIYFFLGGIEPTKVAKYV